MRWTPLVMTIVLISGTVAHGQAPSTESRPSETRSIERLLEQLSAEVRTLRLALEQWHVEDTQLSVAFERRRLQKEIAASAASQLESLRAERLRAEKDSGRMQAERQNAETNLRANPEPQQAQLLSEIAGEAVKASDDARAREAQLLSQERQLAGEVEEQSRILQQWERWLEAAGSRPGRPK